MESIGRGKGLKLSFVEIIETGLIKVAMIVSIVKLMLVPDQGEVLFVNMKRFLQGANPLEESFIWHVYLHFLDLFLFID
jgi:hypothetical protein